MQKPLKATYVKNEIIILSECPPHIVYVHHTFTSNSLNPSLSQFKNVGTQVEIGAW